MLAVVLEKEDQIYLNISLKNRREPVIGAGVEFLDLDSLKLLESTLEIDPPGSFSNPGYPLDQLIPT